MSGSFRLLLHPVARAALAACLFSSIFRTGVSVAIIVSPLIRPRPSVFRAGAMDKINIYFYSSLVCVCARARACVCAREREK